MRLFTEVWAISNQLILKNSKKVASLCFLALVATALLPLLHFKSAAQNRSDQVFELSPRVGSDLDSNEIEYFNIFPELDFIRSAVYRKDNLGNVRFLLSQSDGKDTTVTISNLAAEELGKLISQFEKVPDNPKLINWRLMSGFNPDKLNYFENAGRQVTIYSTAGKFSGRLMMVSDSAICIWQKRGDFQPEEVQRFLRRFDFREIREVEVRPSFSSKLFGASVGAGVAVAALQLGLNITDSEDYVFSGNSIFLLGIGGLMGAVGGFFFDGITAIGRYKSIEGNHSNFLKFSKKHRNHAMFGQVYPPELAAYR